MTIDHHQKQLEAENKKEVETDRYAAETDRMAKTGQFSRVGATGEAEAGSMDRPAGEHKAPMPQSSLEENVMESDWSFLLAEWGRYYEATNLSKDQAAAVRHLWAWSLKFTTTATMVGGIQPFWEAHLRGGVGKTYWIGKKAEKADQKSRIWRGTLGPKIFGWRHKNIFKDRGLEGLVEFDLAKI